MSEEIINRLERIENLLETLASAQKTVDQAYYSTSEAASLLRKAEWTVREWCRLGRVHAIKRAAGRGTSKEWMISQAELQRIRSEGLLPINIRRPS